MLTPLFFISKLIAILFDLEVWQTIITATIIKIFHNLSYHEKKVENFRVSVLWQYGFICILSRLFKFWDCHHIHFSQLFNLFLFLFTPFHFFNQFVTGNPQESINHNHTNNNSKNHVLFLVSKNKWFFTIKLSPGEQRVPYWKSLQSVRGEPWLTLIFMHYSSILVVTQVSGKTQVNLTGVGVRIKLTLVRIKPEVSTSMYI